MWRTAYIFCIDFVKPVPVPEKKERTAKVDSTTPTTTLTTHQLSSDKSLRLLEKELQELTRVRFKNNLDLHRSSSVPFNSVCVCVLNVIQQIVTILF